MKTQNDIKKAEQQELDDNELELVTGGSASNVGAVIHADNFCIADYTCFGVFFHPDDYDEEDACLSHYQCITVSYGCVFVWN